ncbi:MAG: aminopeptidase P family protein [Verrucomicrobia bacterium]|nr:aminopeptidase P family protein [Verrucomicrobiota bacterium]
MTQLNIFLERIKKLQKALRAEKLDGCLVDHSVDLLYLTGLQLSLGALFVLQRKCCLFVDGRYFEVAQKTSPIAVEKLSDENKKAFLKGVKTLAFDGDHVSYNQFLQLKKLKVQLVSKPELIRDLRLIKDVGEIGKMKRSAEFGYMAYLMLKGLLKPGITEIELARELEIYCLKNGAEKMSFEPIIAFGKNSSLPHHRSGDTKLKANDIALFDLGVVLDKYCSDMTRVEFVGKPDPQLKKLYDVNLEAQRAALAVCKPGVKLKELDLAARKVMAKAGLEEYFVHNLGHGIGLQVHEFPRINKVGINKDVELEPGMAITIEPGLYLPGKGGVRYEDTIIITPRGYTNLYPE